MHTINNIEKKYNKIRYKKFCIRISSGIMITALLFVVMTVQNLHNNNNVEQSLQRYIQAAVKTKNNSDAENDVEIISEAINTDNMVTIYLENAGRSDPFLPSSNYEQTDLSDERIYYLTPPPEKAGYDTDAINVVKTKVSGIMYDNYNPAAILNIEGSDYLVKSGDTINNYKILAISPSTVTVQLGANTFKAGVGQMFSEDDMNYINDSFGSERRINF